MNLGIGIVVGVVLLAIVLAVVAFSSREKHFSSDHLTPNGSLKITENVSQPIDVSPTVVMETPPKVSVPSEAERRYAQMKDALRPLPHEGVSGTMALAQHLSMGDPLLSKEDILKAAVDVGFTMESVVGAMDTSGFSLNEVFTFVDDHFMFDIPDLVKLLFTLHHENSSIDWSTSVISAVCERYNSDELDNEDLRALANGGVSVGCTEEEVAKILYAEFNFKNVLTAFIHDEEGVTSEYLAQVARWASVDLTESELYSSLREDYSLALVSGALKILGEKCDDILECEAVYLEMTYDDVSSALEDMEDSGLSTTEILAWLIDSDSSSTMGAEDVITDAFENTDKEELSEDELVWLSLTFEDEVDINNIERKLIENGIDFEERIEFLYKLFVAQQDVRAAKEAQSAAEEATTT